MSRLPHHEQQPVRDALDVYLGAFAFEGLHHLFAGLTPHWELPMGLVVIAMVLLLPRGKYLQPPKVFSLTLYQKDRPSYQS